VQKLGKAANTPLASIISELLGSLGVNPQNLWTGWFG
jgi:hypothetical protein